MQETVTDFGADVNIVNEESFGLINGYMASVSNKTARKNILAMILEAVSDKVYGTWSSIKMNFSMEDSDIKQNLVSLPVFVVWF